MKNEIRRRHLRLIKCDRSVRAVEDLEQELLDQLENLEELEFQILTATPDWTVAMDRRAPLELKLRVLAAVKSHSMGTKSIDYLLRKYRDLWEQDLEREED